MKPDTTPEPLSKRRIEELVSGIALVRRVVVLPTVDSTNDELRRLAGRGAPQGTVVIADQQRLGRGRRGRTWFSPPSQGLYISLLLGPDLLGDHPTRWTLGAAVAACRACRKLSGQEVRIKWPNDLLLGSRKIGGILAEMRSAGDAPVDLVLGIGLNLGQRPEDFPPPLRESATSLHPGAGQGMLERERLAAELLRRLDEMADRLRRGVWQDVAREWEALAPGARGQRVRVADAPSGRTRPGRSGYEGITRGLDAEGALLVERAGGELCAVRLADTVVPLE